MEFVMNIALLKCINYFKKASQASGCMKHHWRDHIKFISQSKNMSKIICVIEWFSCGIKRNIYIYITVFFGWVAFSLLFWCWLIDFSSFLMIIMKSNLSHLECMMTCIIQSINQSELIQSGCTCWLKSMTRGVGNCPSDNCSPQPSC